MTTTQISFTEDILDTRDIVERIEELAADRENLADVERDEFRRLRRFAREYETGMGHALAEAEDYEPTLVADHYFTDYARELAEDIGAIDPNAGWPLRCIDWQQAARELRMDYTPIEFEGATYWTRS